MADSITANLPPVVTQDDNDRQFYAAPEETKEPKNSGYSYPEVAHPRFLMRMTPGPIQLPKGVPVDFTIHIKPLVDFTLAHPLQLTLGPIVGSGSGWFSEPAAAASAGSPQVTLKDEKIFITAKSTDNAAKVILHTEYPPDWWAGSSKCVVTATEGLPVTGDPSQIEVTCVDSNIVVSDRVPAVWHRFIGRVKDPAK